MVPPLRLALPATWVRAGPQFVSACPTDGAFVTRPPARWRGSRAVAGAARGASRAPSPAPTVRPYSPAAAVIPVPDAANAAGPPVTIATAASAGPGRRWRWLIRPSLALLLSLLLPPVGDPRRGGAMQATGGAGTGNAVPGAPPEVTAMPRYDPGGAGPAGPPSAARRSRQERGGVFSVSKVYANVNVERPPSYWDYDSMNIHWGYVGVAGWAGCVVC